MGKFSRLVLLTGSSYLAYQAATNRQKRADYRGLLSSLYNSVRATRVLALSVFDYAYRLRGLDPQFDEYHTKRAEIHTIVANRILDVSVSSRGIYFKAGQYLGNLDRIMPKEYTDVLKVLQDSAPPLPWDQIKVVLKPGHLEQFEHIETEAIAAASLAQVHEARLKSGEKVAVKLQYPFLYMQSQVDFKVLWLISKICNRCLKFFEFRDIDLVQLWKVFKDMCEKEIDFNFERLNAECTKRIFKYDPQVHVPYIYRHLSSSRVLTMEFVEGVKIDNLDGLHKLGFSNQQIRDLLIKVFANMIFKEGHVHCDPHPGNLLIRDVHGKPQLVLLDHGFYRTLSNDFRMTFCELWKSLITFDYDKLKEIAENLGLGRYYRYLPLVFAYRTINSTQPIGTTLSKEERRQLHVSNDLSFEHISRLLQLLPPDMMFVIRTSNMVAIHNFRLGGTTKDRLFAYTGIAYRSLFGNFFSYYWNRMVFFFWNLIYFYFPYLIKKPLD